MNQRRLVVYVVIATDAAPALICTLSLHDALPILIGAGVPASWRLEFAAPLVFVAMTIPLLRDRAMLAAAQQRDGQDRKSTRLNSSHSQRSYAVFCVKKKNLVLTASQGSVFFHKPR